MKTLYTVKPVWVDSVRSDTWVENTGGIKTLTEIKTGIIINWNLGYTLVPWANVVCVEVKS